VQRTRHAPTTRPISEVTRKLILTQPFRRRLSSEARAAHFDFHHSSLPSFNAQPNAGNQPTGTQLTKHPTLRMKAALAPVGCMGLFGGGSTPPKRGAHSSLFNIRASTKTPPPRPYFTRLYRDAERRTSPDGPRSLPTREHYRARHRGRNCFLS